MQLFHFLISVIVLKTIYRVELKIIRQDFIFPVFGDDCCCDCCDNEPIQENKLIIMQTNSLNLSNSASQSALSTFTSTLPLSTFTSASENVEPTLATFVDSNISVAPIPASTESNQFSSGCSCVSSITSQPKEPSNAILPEQQGITQQPQEEAYQSTQETQSQQLIQQQEVTPQTIQAQPVNQSQSQLAVQANGSVSKESAATLAFTSSLITASIPSYTSHQPKDFLIGSTDLTSTFTSTFPVISTAAITTPTNVHSNAVSPLIVTDMSFSTSLLTVQSLSPIYANSNIVHSATFAGARTTTVTSIFTSTTSAGGRIVSKVFTVKHPCHPVISTTVDSTGHVMTITSTITEPGITVTRNSFSDNLITKTNSKGTIVNVIGATMTSTSTSTKKKKNSHSFDNDSDVENGIKEENQTSSWSPRSITQQHSTSISTRSTMTTKGVNRPLTSTKIYNTMSNYVTKTSSKDHLIKTSTKSTLISFTEATSTAKQPTPTNNSKTISKSHIKSNQPLVATPTVAHPTTIASASSYTSTHVK